jgi:acyl carrier protein
MTEATANVEDRIKSVILERLNLKLGAKELTSVTPLVGRGIGLDSVG